MAEKKRKLTLGGVEDLFSTEKERQDAKLEKVQEIPVEQLIPFKNHPFKVVDDEAMLRIVESVAQYGILSPLIARPGPDGSYEVISGHRRKHAAELAGLATVPVLVRDMDDDAATILMVDSNLQREMILPSERAWAYRMKLEAMNHQGQRTDLTSVQIEQKLNARQLIASETGKSEANIQQIIGETTEYDKKLKVETKRPKSWCKSVSAFANTFGGKLIFGISDENQVVGLSAPEKDAEKISEIIKTRLDPVPEFKLKFYKTDDGRILIILDVFQGEETPYYYSGDGVLEAYVRVGNESVKATSTELKRLVLRGLNSSFDSRESSYKTIDYAFTKLRERY